MLFNSLQFAIFFVIVYALYLMLKHKWQNRMLLLASYVFYGSWDWRFLSLILASTVLDYICGIKIHESRDDRRRKWFLCFSIIGNLSILGFFKYFDFFATSFQSLLGLFGLSVQPHLLRVILPMGISFYTFQTMSYTIDIYRREMEPTRKFFDFALFVAFFPQLVAGPIERARHLLPQMLAPRKMSLDKFYNGCCLIFWGLFLKIFVADNLARIVDPVFAEVPPYNGLKVLLALYAFAFQIFSDFAGYSSIARGLGKCMGFEIMINFNLPYFSTNPQEFWRRWHISLSNWLRDYLYIPLGGNRKGTVITYRNLAITMLLGGLWHGAAWTFITWGAYHGAILIIYRILKPFFEKKSFSKGALIGKAWFWVKVVFFFHLMCLGWLIFRAQSMTQVFQMMQSLFINFYEFQLVRGISIMHSAAIIVSCVWLVLIIQLIQHWKNDLMVVYKWPAALIAVIHAIMFYLIVLHGTPGYKFIYFQF